MDHSRTVSSGQVGDDRPQFVRGGGGERPFEPKFQLGGAEPAVRVGLLDEIGRRGWNSVAGHVVDMLRGCRVFHFHDTSTNALSSRPGTPPTTSRSTPMRGTWPPSCSACSKPTPPFIGGSCVPSGRSPRSVTREVIEPYLQSTDLSSRDPSSPPNAPQAALPTREDCPHGASSKRRSICSCATPPSPC